MALDGDTTNKQQLFVIPDSLVGGTGVAIPPNPNPGCCADYQLLALADNSGIATQNDIIPVRWRFPNFVTGAILKIKKMQSGAWVTKATISNDNYGVFNDFGFATNKAGENWIELQTDFSKILAAGGCGIGCYKITCTFTPAIGDPVDVDSYEFNLKTYSPSLADGTIRLEWWTWGVVGNKEIDTDIIDYGVLTSGARRIAYSSVRVNGLFGWPKASYKISEVPLVDGEIEDVENFQTAIFQLALKNIAFFIHEILRCEFMMARKMASTVYSSRNPGKYVQKYIKKESGYEPEWWEEQSDFASITMQFRQANNRHRAFPE